MRWRCIGGSGEDLGLVMEGELHVIRGDTIARGGAHIDTGCNSAAVKQEVTLPFL